MEQSLYLLQQSQEVVCACKKSALCILTSSGIYQLEQKAHKGGPTAHDPEASPLLDTTFDDPDGIFTRLLDHDLNKIYSFYQSKEDEIFEEVNAFLQDEQEYVQGRDGITDAAGTSRKPSASTERATSSLRRRPDPVNRSRSVTSQVDGHGDEDSDARDGDSDGDTATSPQRSRSQFRQDSTPGRKKKRRSSAGLGPPEDDHVYTQLFAQGVTLKKRAISLYVNLCELRSFIQLNRTGFQKVLKKYDKILDRNLKQPYIKSKIDTARPFQTQTTESINSHVRTVEEAYANVITKGDLEVARQELRLHLREHVVWERNTVWREMIGIERKAQAANMGFRQTVLGTETDPRKTRLQGDEPESYVADLKTPVGRIRCPRFLLSPAFYMLIGILVVFALLLALPIMDKPEQQNCLALVVLVSLLWATEAIPLFVTSLLVPFLVVVLGVARDEVLDRRLDSKHAASYVFSAMWTPVIMLLLGGFTIAAALSKYNIAKMMATFVLSKAGTRPSTVIVMSMFVSMFASMWISNVAAPVLCYSIVQVCWLRLCLYML